MIIEKTQGCSFYFWNSNHERVMKNIIIFSLILSLVATPTIVSVLLTHSQQTSKWANICKNSIYVLFDFLVSLPRPKLLVVQEWFTFFSKKVAKNWERPNVQNLFRFLQVSFWSKRWRKTGTEFRSTHTSTIILRHHSEPRSPLYPLYDVIT